MSLFAKAKSYPYLLFILFPWTLLFLCLWNVFHSKRIEQFEDASSIKNVLQQLDQLEHMASETEAFNRFVGYLYAHPEVSADALNDVKRRILQPSCQFRMDWSSQLPNGLTKPVSPSSKEEANAAYNTFLRCASKNGTCQKQLDEFILRFMQPGCSINLQADFSTLGNDLKPIFN